MITKPIKLGGTGLEQLRPQDWIRSTIADGGVEFFEARLHGHPYHKHRHDVYAICLTTAGILAFDYRGSSEVSGPGEIVVLHPDEIHDGYAGVVGVFGYRQVYIDPEAVFEAIRSLSGQVRALPFVRRPVVRSRTLASAIRSAFDSTREPLAIDNLVVRLAEGLMEADPACKPVVRPRHVDAAAVIRAREYLDAHKTRVVRSSELEAVTGLIRHDLVRHFRTMCGTSPYRYLLMRRLQFARQQLHQGRSLTDVAVESGFADQAHFTRAFKSTFGITPGRYRALWRALPAGSGRS